MTKSDIGGTMACRIARDLLFDHSRGTLEGEAVREVETHLARCPACAEALEAVRRVGGVVADLGPVVAGRDLALRVKRAAMLEVADGWGTTLSPLLVEAVRARATAVHLEPEAGGARRYHIIDGAPVAAPSLRGAEAAEVLAAAGRAPGGFRHEAEGRGVHVRVTRLPVIGGERFHFVLEDDPGTAPDPRTLGLDGGHLARLLAWAGQGGGGGGGGGLLLVAGPTGSGRSTTALALAREAALQGRLVLTLEERPIWTLGGVCRAIADGRGADGVRQALAQGAEVLLVDGPIAPAAIAAAAEGALAGTFVMLVLTATTARGALRRGLEAGVPGWILRDAVRGALCQRLVRRTCPGCRAAHRPAAWVEREARAVLGAGRREWMAGKGCADCGGTGFRGRMAIGDFIEATSGLWPRLAREGASERDRGRGNRLRPLRAHGFARALAGETTPEEVLRVTSLG